MASRLGIATSFKSLGSSSSEDQFAEFVDSVRASSSSDGKQLLCLLHERHPVYLGRSTKSVERMRGYLMATFESTGLPANALPFVLESLESTFDPYAVGGAARAVRGMSSSHPQVAHYLVKAIFNTWRADQPVSYESYRVQWPLDSFTTAVGEILRSLEWMGGAASGVVPDLELLVEQCHDQFDGMTLECLKATLQVIRGDTENHIDDCCQLPSAITKISSQRSSAKDLNPVLEDQNGEQIKWQDFFRNKYSVLAFFYTRCNNPRKCTLTIQTLVAIQCALKSNNLGGRVKTAAITYDSTYDTSSALQAYGEARQFAFSKNHRMFRIPNGFENVVDKMDLGVNFRGEVVNHHRIEFFLLDPQGELVRTFVRLKVEPSQVIEAIREELSLTQSTKPEDSRLLPAPRTSRVFGSLGSNALAIVLPILIALFPKCPLCWASYMSLLGVAGIGTIPYSPWILPIIIGFLGGNLWIMYRSAHVRNGMLPFYLCSAGSIALFSIWATGGQAQLLFWPGFGFLLLGSMLNSLSFNKFNKLRLFLLKLKWC